MGKVESKFFSKDARKTVVKPVFMPNNTLRGYGVGILFPTYGKTFLFVGQLPGHDHNVLCISDWSTIDDDTGKKEFLLNIAKNGIDTDKFILVSDQHVHDDSSGSLAAYVISDLQQILSVLELVKKSGIDKEPLNTLQASTQGLLAKQMASKK